MDFADFDAAGNWRATEQVGIPLWIDDRRLLLHDRSNAVVDVDTATGVRRTLGRVDGSALSTDGRYLVAATHSGGVAVYRLTQ